MGDKPKTQLKGETGIEKCLSKRGICEREKTKGKTQGEFFNP
jgi:hypothetical protein